jgi:4-aminobutyrate aminotransferase / (S)-3-amino-2-methylpropionate transaminase / 5-aminovalerate transaminase
MGVKEQYRDYVMTGFVKRVEPVVADHGDGALLYDADGTEYVDCFAGISVTNAGHGNQKIIAAAKAQADKLVHACSYVYHVPTVGALAEKLAQITPGKLQKTFFSNSGAEALEGAMRVAKRYSGKSEMLALESSFHGRTNATLSITGNSARKKGGYTYLSGIAFAPAPYCYRCFAETTPDKCDLLCARRVGEVMRLHLSGNVCAFIAEPVMGEGGIIVPPDGYFKRVKQILDDEGALFICDEVQSGFGRTGKMFAIEHFGVDPDIICMAKGIANGWPLGAFTATAEIADSFQVGDHLSTFGGNPVSCAASLANLAFFEEAGLVQQSATKGGALKARFEGLMKEQPLIGEVRGKGLMIGVELVQDRTTKVPASAAAGFVRQYCLDHGVLIGVGGNFASVLRIQPPLVITEEQMDKTFTTVADGLRAAEK